MDEYIRREDAVDAMGKAQWAKERLLDIEPADVVHVVHGRWIEEWWHGDKTRKCSVCNLTQTVNVYKGEVKFNYCPYCAAKMDREE